MANKDGAAVDAALIDRALAEDLGAGDLTALIIPSSRMATAILTTREKHLVCGTAWFDSVFSRLDPEMQSEWFVADGDDVDGGTPLCRMRGKARALLSGERTALNLLQTLSGTATKSRRYAESIAGTGCRVLDTRKTIPGLREAQKYAVRCGGCVNHRHGLYDGILIKENHISAAGSIAQAVAAARGIHGALPVEVEVENLDELDQALKASAERILLDNFDVTTIRDAVIRTAGRAKLEASGNVSLENIREIAETGVDFISAGDLTKNVEAIDLSLRIHLEP